VQLKQGCLQTYLESQREGRPFALLFIDFDSLKQAGEQIDPDTSGRLMAQVAERISARVRAMDTVARLGGDEFTLILKETSRKDAKKAAKGLLDSLEQAFVVNSHPLHLSGSIGLTMFPDDGKNIDQMMNNAGKAKNAARELGGHQVKFYESWMA